MNLQHTSTTNVLPASNNIWFTSDTHFYHKKIVEYCKRPWNSVEEMNEGLIERWNSVVKPDDTIYHLGDFAFAGATKTLDILRRLNGNKRWIRGNHDHPKVTQRAVDEGLVQWCRDYYLLRVADQDMDGSYTQMIALCHFPIESWDSLHHGAWHLHGHCHGSLPSDGKRMDAGVDCNTWYPISYDDVKLVLSKRPIHIVDHHGQEEHAKTFNH
jgi:calcineurin-like phosphoesterase family protein